MQYSVLFISTLAFVSASAVPVTDLQGPQPAGQQGPGQQGPGQQGSGQQGPGSQGTGHQGPSGPQGSPNAPGTQPQQGPPPAPFQQPAICQYMAQVCQPPSGHQGAPRDTLQLASETADVHTSDELGSDAQVKAPYGYGGYGYYPPPPPPPPYGGPPPPPPGFYGGYHRDAQV